MRKFLLLAAVFYGIANSSFALPLSEAVGFYTDGSLRYADGLPIKGQGFMKLFVPRQRNWGTHDLNTLLKDVAEELARAYPNGERLQIGDQSDRDGGFISGHSSHQNGLDVDLAYLRKNRREQDPNRTAGFDEDFVKNGAVTKNFDLERNWALLKLFVRLGNVNRIFMDVEIKRTLCEFAKANGEAKSQAETLRRLRPWPNHSHHMHVRLKCPKGSSQCIAQDEVPGGSGCSAAELIILDNEF